MAARGPSLGFDPQYVEFVISAWRDQGFTPLLADELQSLAQEHAERALTRLNRIGLYEQHAKPAAVKSAVSLLKSLKLIKESTSGRGAARQVKIATTPLGKELLAQTPASGGIRVRLVGLLVTNSVPLTNLLRRLGEHGPLSRPVVSPLPGTPTKGAAFSRSLLEGLAEYKARIPASTALSPARQTASQALTQAKDSATRNHPIAATGALSALDKQLTLAAGLGLLWRDVEQVNRSLGIESIGLATATQGGVFPNAPSWEEAAAGFQESLWRVYLQRVDGSGFATIGALRGGIGRELHISAPVVDAFLCLAREAGERGDSSLTLQFEPNDDLVVDTKGRKPLVWEGAAFDSVEVHRAPASVGENLTSHRPARSV